MTGEEITVEIDREALRAIPVFPLPGTVLLPNTLVSLHIFEPRYRQMMAYCLEEHRVMAIAMLNEHGQPDIHGRPPVFPTAGLGYVRRSARLPDGRYNVVLEGVARLDVSEELAPETAFRRSNAVLLEDSHVDTDLRPEANALRSLATRSLAGNTKHSDLLASISQLEPGLLADSIAAAVFEDVQERQRILEAVEVSDRLRRVSGVLGAMLLQSPEEDEQEDGEPRLPRWGIAPGKA